MKGSSNRPRIARAGVLLALVVTTALSPTRQASAQSSALTVSPISPEGGSAAPGQTLPSGVFAMINNLPFTQTVSSITIAFSNPSLFSSATLTGPNGVSVSSNPPSFIDTNGPPPASSKHPPASTAFSFSPPICDRAQRSTVFRAYGEAGAFTEPQRAWQRRLREHDSLGSRARSGRTVMVGICDAWPCDCYVAGPRPLTHMAASGFDGPIRDRDARMRR
jgi:hypothetical protein